MVGIAVLIVTIGIVVKKKINRSKETVPADTLTRNEFRNNAFYIAARSTHEITSTVSYDTIRPHPGHTTKAIKIQPNPSYGRSDKVVMDSNPAYKASK